MKVTTKGQVTIPLHIRRFLGISAYSEVEFAIRGDDVVLVPLERGATEAPPSRFHRLRGIKRGERTTDEWMRETRGS